MLLKEIPGVLPSLVNSFLSTSKLWERPVEQIIPQQLVALRWLAIEAGQENVDVQLEYLLNQANIAALEGLLPNDTPILAYKPRRDMTILSSELTEGLAKLPPSMARAAIFGLEMDMSLEQIMTLTFKQAQGLEMTETARKALRDQVRSMTTSLAFWQLDTRTDSHGPLFGFANEVYANFDMSWNALRLSYKGLIPAHFGIVDNKE